jgi:hypothetical protein
MRVIEHTLPELQAEDAEHDTLDDEAEPLSTTATS